VNWASLVGKLADLGIRIIDRVWPSKADEPSADPRDIATAQSSGYAADRSGKATSKRARESNP
jgi:hypothetical protein